MADTIRTSESINQLSSARVAFARKNIAFLAESTNPHFGNAYASLPYVLNKTIQPLAECGLTVVQGATLLHGEFAVVTRLIHTSGEWLETVLPIPPSAKALERDASQAILSAYTYGRRGSLLALLGLAPVDPKEQNLLELDDDGNTAAGKTKPVVHTAATPVPPTEATGPTISPKQAKRLYAIAKSHDVDVEAFQSYLTETYGYTRFAAIKVADYEALVQLAESGTKFSGSDELTADDIGFE
tara:strand:- start:3253 stop:3978 length:726 start_codon:yes stop_codon:yes gene_type:complete